MNLSQLVKTFDKQSGDFEAVSIVYDGNDVHFQAKTTVRVDEYEYIYIKDQGAEKHSTLARRIVKLCRDQDGNRFELDDVLGWPFDLVVLVISETLDKEEVEEVVEGENKKKTS